MTNTQLFEDALTRITTAFEDEFIDYSGTMSYLDDERDAEVNNLLKRGAINSLFIK